MVFLSNVWEHLQVVVCVRVKEGEGMQRQITVIQIHLNGIIKLNQLMINSTWKYHLNKGLPPQYIAFDGKAQVNFK